MVAGYVDSPASVFRGTPPVIIFGDHTRRFKHVDFPFAIGAEGVKILLPSQAMDSRYLFRFLETVAIPSAGYSRHFKFLKDVRVPLPPLDEQRRIARVLDSADALRTKRRRVLQDLKPLPQALFAEVFDEGPRLNGAQEPLGAVGEVVSGLTKGRRTPSGPLREVPYLAVSNVQDQRLNNLARTKTIYASEREIERYRLLPGDLLLTEGGDPDKLGRGTLWLSFRTSGRQYLPPPELGEGQERGAALR